MKLDYVLGTKVSELLTKNFCQRNLRQITILTEIYQLSQIQKE